MALRRILLYIFFIEFALVFVCYARRTDSGNWTSGAGKRTPQTSLYLDLMDAYGPRTPRPVLNDSDQIQVGIGARPFSLVEFNEKAQTLSLQIALQMTWTDQKLTWDPNDYSGLKTLIINTEDVWVPDIILTESVGGTFSEVNNGFAEVTYEGDILWYDMVVTESFCKLLIRYFPFDVQHCSLTFTSWNYNLSKIDFYHSNVLTIEEQLESFVVNGLWKLSGLKIEHFNHTFTDDELWPSVRYVVEFQRTQASFYATNILLPCILLSLMNLLVFVLPTEAGEKVSFVMTNVLTLVLFQQLVATMLPPSGDDTPIFSLHIFWMIVFGSVAIVWTVLVIVVYFEKQNYPQRLYSLLTSFRCLYHNLSFGKKEASNRKYVILTKSRQLLYGDLEGSQFNLKGEHSDEEMDQRTNADQANHEGEFEMHPLEDTIERWTDDGIKIYKASTRTLPLDGNDDDPEPRESLKDKIKMMFCGHCGQVNATRLQMKKEVYSFDPKDEALWQETAELLDKIMSYIMVFMTILVYFLLILRFAVHDPHDYRSANQ